MIEDIEDAITLSMQEASMMAEIEAQERQLNRTWEMIQNRGVKQTKKQARKLTREEADLQELAMKQRMCNWDE